MADKSSQVKPRVNSHLLSHVRDKSEKNTLRELYIESGVVLDQTLKPLILKKIEESNKLCDQINIYEIVHMTQFLADQSGYRRALREVLKLLPRS